MPTDHESTSSGEHPRRQTLLIVEPNRLTRWSVQEYLRDCFIVLEADGADRAHALLDTSIVDALVIADDLPALGADEVERHARRCNPEVNAVRIGTDPVVGGRGRTAGAKRLEKPFKLSALADSLGVSPRMVHPRSHPH